MVVETQAGEPNCLIRPGATIYSGFGETNFFPLLSVKLDNYKIYYYYCES